MPSSRKRNKGKERKAKKVQSQRANVREIWWGFTTRKNITTQTAVSIISGLSTTWRQPSRVVAMILTLYEYGTTMNIESAFLSQNVIAKTRDLAPDMSSFKRDALKFYRKRVSCKCLKRIHLEARKTMPKMGKCLHCGVEKERESFYLFVVDVWLVTFARGSAKLQIGLIMSHIVLPMSMSRLISIKKRKWQCQLHRLETTLQPLDMSIAN